jgi:hypothetical protein
MENDVNFKLFENHPIAKRKKIIMSFPSHKTKILSGCLLKLVLKLDEIREFMKK